MFRLCPAPLEPSPNKLASRALLAFVLVALVNPLSASEAGPALRWREVASGIDYQRYELEDPNVVYVARMDTQNPNVTIESSIAGGLVLEGKETVSEMAERYEETLNAWGGTWGRRNDVVVAINGSFHNIKTGLAEGGMIHSGWYAKAYGDLQGGSGFAWTLDREAFIGQCVGHSEGSMSVTFLATGVTQEIDRINSTKKRNRLVVYTPQFGSNTGTGRDVAEVLVELSGPMRIGANQNRTFGIIREVRPDEGSTPIPFDHIVLTAKGDPVDMLLANASVGDRVAISIELDHYGADCQQQRRVSWANTYANIAGSFIFLKRGEIQTFDDPGANARHPRTAVCINDRYVYFVVVDGRDSERSQGMSVGELGAFCRDRLDATWGINQDGGGSSAMWVDGEIVNFPSDGAEREVANGLMMVRVVPEKRSYEFLPGDVAQATRRTKLRLGPGTNYAALASVPKAQSVQLIPHINRLEGIFATGEYWWKVAHDGREGWVQEDTLSGTPDARSRERETAVLSELDFHQAFRALHAHLAIFGVSPLQR